MKRPTGSPRLHLASSVTEKALVANTEERWRSALASLEQCRTFLTDSGSRETAQLLSVAILDLRMKLHRIADSGAEALCDAMSLHRAKASKSRNGQPGIARPR